jgi:D-threo-aldose 1-dehydrogenase
VISGAFNSGLTSTPRPGTPANDRLESASWISRAGKIRDLCGIYNVPLHAAALAFPLHHPAVATVLVGCRTPGEVLGGTQLLAHKIPDGLWQELGV